jgi:hypothetical protein
MSVAAAALLLAAGCAKPAGGPGFDVLSTRTPTGPLAAADLDPTREGDWTYLVTAGEGSGEPTLYRRRATEQYGAAWVEDQADRRSEYRRMDDEGNEVMLVVVDHAHNAITWFRPPLIAAYREMEPGRTYEQQVRMRVMDARRPDRERYRGTATQTIVYGDDEILHTPLGELNTKRLSIHFTADLGSVGAETATTLWIVPGVGPAVIQRTQSERVLGIHAPGRDQTLVLTKAPDGPQVRQLPLEFRPALERVGHDVSQRRPELALDRVEHAVDLVAVAGLDLLREPVEGSRLAAAARRSQHASLEHPPMAIEAVVRAGRFQVSQGEIQHRGRPLAIEGPGRIIGATGLGRLQ